MPALTGRERATRFALACNLLKQPELSTIAPRDVITDSAFVADCTLCVVPELGDKYLTRAALGA
jgi:hypothetical protein